VIRLPDDILVAATQASPATEHYDESTFDFSNVTVTDVAAWRKAVCDALNREDGDGTTLVHRMFDRAFIDAIEGGAEGISVPGLTD